jgi:basic membrane protein A
VPKIGVVTDVGTVNDKNFNEYTYLGATNGAAAIGAEKPPVVVPKDASEYAKLIQDYVDQGFDTIITIGFNLGADTTAAAAKNPKVTFIGIDQSPICVDAQGNPDKGPDANTAADCDGKAAEVRPNYISLYYAEDQAGYLAGMVAATISKTNVIGAIGGINLCGPCIKYFQGYELGAKSIKPDIKVMTAWVASGFDFNKAFNDPVAGKNFGQQFIKQNKPDVLFQVAGKTGNGVLDAACEAGIYGIGVDVDQALSYPNAAKCTVTSAEKKLATSVETTIKALYAATAKPGDNYWSAAQNGIGYAPFHEFESLYTPELKAALDSAFFAMQAGTLKTCPDNCGKLE